MTFSDDAFLSAVFAKPNTVWPNRDPRHPSAAYLERFFGALSQKNEAPLVLPRKEAEWPVPITYVVCWSPSHAGRIRMLLNAGVEHNWCIFDGRLAQLHEDDPFESAILSLVGTGTTYRLRPPNTRAHRGLFRALSRMVNTIEQRPSRVSRMPRPVGRLLRDFETSLASGQALTSLELLESIEQCGGVSHENVAFLRLRRLGQLGADQEVLRSPSLSSVVAVEPPRLVREAILGAWFRNTGRDWRGLAQSLDDELDEFGVDVALLVDETLAHTADADAWTASAVVALARGDAELAHRLLDSVVDGDADLRQELKTLLNAYSEPVAERPGPKLETVPEPEAGPERAQAVEQNSDLDRELHIDVPRPDAALGSWAEWLASIAAGNDAPLTLDLTEGWTAPGESDAQLAAAIQELHISLTDRLFTGLGAFIDADDPARPAVRTSAELILRHLLGDRLTHSDLGAMSALLGIFLRGAPDARAYGELLQDLAGFKGLWSSIDTAPAAIDIADLVVCAPSASSDARQGFVASALEPLYALRHRLSESLRTVAALVTADLGLDWNWTVPNVSPIDAEVPSPLLPASILLYSLDKGVLARVKTAVAELHPSIALHVSDAKVGSDALRTHSRNAELVVLATRKATHAATLFIQGHVSEGARVTYADGCGSGSMMRAVDEGILSFGAQ